MRLYNINANLMQVIENLCNKANSAVYLNGGIGDWLRTTVGVRQGCLLSPTLFNIFLERIVTDALDYRQGTVSIWGSTITNLRFTDDIDGLAGKEEELASLVDRLDKTSAAFDTKSSAEKTKLMTNNTNGISIDIRINGEKLNNVDSLEWKGCQVRGALTVTMTTG